MGYQVPKHHNKRGWKVLHVRYEGGKRIYRGVPAEEYAALGIAETMTREQVMERLGQKNAQAELSRHETKRNVIQDKLKTARLSDMAFMPATLLAEFEATRLDMTRPKLRSYWKKATEILGEVRLEPKDWDDNAAAFFRAFTKRQMSPNYVRQVLPLINAWGKFVAKRTQTFFVPLPTMRGGHYKAVAEAYYSKEGHHAGNRESAPLSPEKLESKRSQLKDKHYKWLYLSVWFGLRPIEVDLLRKPTSKRTWWVDEHNGKKVLWVYQTKLKGVKPEKRVKYIPCITPEQELGLGFIGQDIKRPLAKTMARVFAGVDPITLYGGRKAFEETMKARGQSFENISAWLGHTSVVRTYQNYYNRHKVKWDDAA
jgi:hypothetical protein